MCSTTALPQSPQRMVFNLRGPNPRPIFLSEPDWTGRMFSLAMTPHWQGIACEKGYVDVEGSSYLLFPEAAAGQLYSAHFNPDSPYFYSFFGTYAIAPQGGKRLPPEIFAELGNRDNLAWLSTMGDPHPFSAVTTPTILLPEPGEVDRWSFVATYAIHSGLGLNNPRSELPELLLPPESGVWSNTIDSYQNMVMHCQGKIWYEGDYLIMSFFTGAEYFRRSGKRFNTFHQFPAFYQQQVRMLDAVKIINDGSGFSTPDRTSFAEKRTHYETRS
jgi:hypothetical protein